VGWIRSSGLDWAWSLKQLGRSYCCTSREQLGRPGIVRSAGVEGDPGSEHPGVARIGCSWAGLEQLGRLASKGISGRGGASRMEVSGGGTSCSEVADRRRTGVLMVA
jgi:hypothetical protein